MTPILIVIMMKMIVVIKLKKGNMYIFILFPMYFNHKKKHARSNDNELRRDKNISIFPLVVSDIRSSSVREQERRQSAWIDYFYIVYCTDERREKKAVDVCETSRHAATYSYAMKKDVTACDGF